MHNTEYYKELYVNNVVSKEPSSFAISVQHLVANKHIHDLGAGNLRDSLFLSSHAASVTSVDPASPKSLILDIVNKTALDYVSSLDSSDLKIGKEIVYARFFWHLLPVEERSSLLRELDKKFPKDTLFLFEYRFKHLIDEPNHPSRQYLDETFIETLSNSLNAKVLYEELGYFSKQSEKNNPLIQRVHLQKL